MSTAHVETETLKGGAIASIKKWWRALRPESFPVSAVPALLGMTVAWTQGYRIDALLAVLTFVGALAIHAATNLLQDYFDFRGGLDRAGALGGSGVLVSGACTPRAVLIAAGAFFVLSAILAGYLTYASGIALAFIAGAGLLFGAGYAVPRYGLKYNFLGDVGVFVAFGIGITVGSYYIQAGRLEWYPVVYALPFGLLVDALLHANNMRDALDDAKAGLRNPAFRMGRGRSRAFFAFLVVAAYASSVAFVFLGWAHREIVLVLITFPVALRLVQSVMGSEDVDRERLSAAVGRTALLSLLFGVSMIAGLIFFGLISGA